MKYMIASDLHGSAYWCSKMLDAFEKNGAECLLLLGDILYHGPRNDLPKDYSPKEVIEMLNPLADKILCVRGNCEAEVDQMVLDFPVLADYALLTDEKMRLFLTHGHLYHEGNVPKFAKGTVMIHGHTHVPICHPHFGEEDCADYICMNPGSISIPKDGSCHSYMIAEEGSFTWHDLETGEMYRKYEIE